MSDTRVRRLDNLLAKPDLFRIVEELGLFLLSYPGFLMVELVSGGVFQFLIFLLVIIVML